MAKAVFRAQADDDLTLWVKSNAVVLDVLGSHFAAKLQEAAGVGVTVVFRVPSRFGQFVDDDVLRGVRGVAHSKVDHIGAGFPLLVQKAVDLREQVRRQSPDTFRDVDGKWIFLVDRLAIIGIVTHVNCSYTCFKRVGAATGDSAAYVAFGAWPLMWRITAPSRTVLNLSIILRQPFFGNGGELHVGFGK